MYCVTLQLLIASYSIIITVYQIISSSQPKQTEKEKQTAAALR